jgi:hypothetical protein
MTVIVRHCHDQNSITNSCGAAVAAAAVVAAAAAASAAVAVLGVTAFGYPRGKAC